jgi:hypothetical protein
MTNAASSSSSGQRVAMTALAPAAKKARARLNGPSPETSEPSAESHADNTMTRPRRSSAAISSGCSHPSS